MAENVVFPLINKLNELISNKLYLVWGVDVKIFSLRNKLALMQAFLKYADAERRDNEMIRVWVDQVRDVAFRAEDVIDRHIYEVQHRRHSGLVGSMKTFANHICRLKTRYDLGVDIAEINQMLQEISDSKSEFGIKFKESPGKASPSLSNSKPMLDIEEANVVGFGKDKDAIMKQLVEGEKKLCVVSIVGMGGLGKTTLARNIYNSNDVKEKFDCQIWISVSQKYTRLELLKAIVKDQLKLEWKEEAKMKEPDMEVEVKKHLRGKKYLLVIDDIWENAAWNEISSVLPNENNGSRIMVTTRNKDVAQHVDPHGFIHELALLNEEESWNLFCSKAFGNKECCPRELEETGKGIVAKCGGLPLAIVIVGGLLWRKPQSEMEWRKVLKRITYELHERTDAQNVRRILALSYDDLPHHLRSCFLYLGLFPEDSEIDAERLIQLWVAEGFVQQRGEETMEEAAEEYLEELANRSMIQVVKRSSWGRVASCRIHDLLLDVAVSQGREDKFLGIVAAGDAPASYAHSTCTPRRLAVHRTSVSELCVPAHPYSSWSQSLLRSLLVGFHAEATVPQVRLLIKNMKLLRVLDLQGIDIDKLPKQIGSMVHLRFMGLGYTSMSELPPSIGRLHNLQTLKLNMHRSCSVPRVIWKIKTLRHVSGVRIQSKIVDYGCKGALQTLWGITGRSLVRIRLHEFANLRNLSIDFISASRMSGLLTESLARLTRLNSLELFIKCGPDRATTMMISSALANHPVLYYLCLHFRDEGDSRSGRAREVTPPSDGVSPLFPASLTEISLKGTGFSMQELMALQSLPNLKILRLWNNAYTGNEMVLSADGFKKLQELIVSCQEQLQRWTIEKGAMPSLRHLLIERCEQLEMVPEGLQHITALQRLEFCFMPRFEQRVKKEGEDWDKVRHIPSLSFINVANIRDRRYMP